MTKHGSKTLRYQNWKESKKVLAAIKAENGPPKNFIFCSSRKLSKAERNYLVFTLEILTLRNEFLSARTLFSFAKIKVFVDAKSILFIRLCKSSSDQIARLAVFLSGFEMELFYVSSNDNFLSDYFSRLPRPGEETDSSQKKKPQPY